MFGASQTFGDGLCAPNYQYPSYVAFYNQFWPIMIVTSVTILPTTLMLILLTRIVIRIRQRQRQIEPISLDNRDKRRSCFIQQQMLIMMFVNVILFFVTTLPEALFRFIIGTVEVQLPYSVILLLTATFGMLSNLNYSLSFSLHCLVSKLYRKQLFECFKAICCKSQRLSTH